MAEVEVLLPKMGESVAEATITNWLKSEGDTVEEDESIVEIATDKVDSEVPSPVSGKLIKIFHKEGEVVQVGKVLAIIESENAGEPDIKTSTIIEEEETKKPVNISSFKSPKGRFYSPLVRTIAKKEGLSFEELEKIKGSGKNGRVTKKDILFYLENKKSQTLSSDVIKDVKEETTHVELKAPVFEGDEIIEMDRMRKLIAEHMIMSKRVSPHVTSFVEADVTAIVKWRERIKDKFLQEEGEKITYTPIIIEAVVKAIKDFPLINVSVDGNKIIKHKNINIGMATALPSGNLIVPVIKNADTLNLIGLTKKVNDLAERARNNKLNPDEIQDGTFTVTNVGTFGNVMGTPIINQPQVAILAVGAIRKKPAVIETPYGDTIGIRHLMFLSLSYDHRVVDGALGGSFLRKVADYLENFDINRNF